MAVDMSLGAHMSSKELLKVTKQLRFLYGVNRRLARPAHVHLTGVDEAGPLYQSCLRRNQGFAAYGWTTSAKSHNELFPRESLVFLTPDSPHVLTQLSADKVRVGLAAECLLS